MVYKSAVIGCGRIGSLFDSDPKRNIISSHCGAYTLHHRTELVSICDIDPNKVIKCKNQWSVRSHYTDYQKMLNNEDIDILSICTHPDSHEKIVDFAVKNHVKAIFCEKPISNNLSSAYRINNNCDKYNVQLAINHGRRWDDFYVNIKNNLIKENFGKIQHINFYYTRGIANSGSHLFDLLRYFFGNIVSVNSISKIDEIKNDPTLTCTLKTDNGLLCNLIGLDGRYYRIFDLEIFGSKSKISIDTSKHIRYLISRPSKRSSEFNELYDAIYTEKIIKDNQNFINTLSNIIDAIEGNSHIVCTGIDGYKSLELIIAAKLSYEMKRKIELPLNKDYYNESI